MKNLEKRISDEHHTTKSSDLQANLVVDLMSLHLCISRSKQFIAQIKLKQLKRVNSSSDQKLSR